MFAKILIIDKRRELPAKYKKSLENSETSVKIVKTFQDGIKEIRDLEPDVILVSDSIDETLTDSCEKIRALTFNMRPIVIALSKSADSNDRILTLESGADDFLSEPVNIEEFKTRIRAHLRRDIELNLDTKTLLPNRRLVEKSLKQVINSETRYAVLLVGVENLDNYKTIYSEIAGEKLIQTFVAITKSSLEEEDFFGQLNDENFIIITNIYRVEKIAAFLTFAFDTVAPKFYSEIDAKRGYSLLKGDRLAEMRANFVSIQIGGMLEFELVNNVQSLLERLISIKKNARIARGSSYLIDRLRISGENYSDDKLYNNHIYLHEPDEALSLLIRTTLELQGYDVVESIDLESDSPPGILILDNSNDEDGLSDCKKIRSSANFVNSKIIVTTSIHDKTAVLDAGADLYLPKPYEIMDLIKWIEFFKKNEH